MLPKQCGDHFQNMHILNHYTGKLMSSTKKLLVVPQTNTMLYVNYASIKIIQKSSLFSLHSCQLASS